MLSSPLPFLVALVTIATAATTPVCSSVPYKNLLFLSSYTPAVKFCSTKFPIATPACTAFVTVPTVVSTTITVTTPATTTLATSTTGVPATIAVSQTITPEPVTTTTTIPVTTTITIDQANKKRAASVNSAQASASFKALSILASNIVKTACSCIETTPKCTTVTSTRTSISTKTFTATVATLVGVTQLLPNTEIVTLTASTTLNAQTVTETATTVIATAIVCGNGLSLCNGQCKDLTSDASNCGACGNVVSQVPVPSTHDL
ncbi:hypothetical protein LTR10_001466 [Elasticomyces elasticus]|nr:hypothetical protein LTR10_001466 [Elasticomyces elasticus]KAK4974968.1 hypothetical protein LTR42_004177 [Elasticomyces elasticus]